MKQLLLICSAIVLQATAWAQRGTPGLTFMFPLGSNETQLVKADYLPYGSSGARIQLPKGLLLVKETPEVFILSGKLEQAVDVIRLVTQTDTVDIPCRNSRNITTKLSVTLGKPAQKVGIKGSYNGWTLDEKSIKPVGNLPSQSWVVEHIEGNEGFIQYKLVVDGVEANPTNAELVDNGMGGTNALLKLGDPDGLVPHASTQLITGNKVGIHIKDGTHYWVLWNNHLLTHASIPVSGNIEIVLPNRVQQSTGRSYIRIYTSSVSKVGNDLLIPLENGHVITQTNELKRTDHHTQIMYFMMVDRFANGDLSNDPIPLDSVLPKAQYLGGDLKGIQQKMKAGFFEQLGVNTIWLSPISQNPQGAWGFWNKEVTTKFSAYHGYWPTSYSKVDARFGSNGLFGEVIKMAHAQNTNIVLDFVAHHVHTDHPLYKLHPDWVTPLYLPDGSMNTERWDDHRLTTWFDIFLPTLNFENKAVRELVADSVMFWVKNYDLDGFRHDASKHVPEEFWRLLTQKIKIEQHKKGDVAFYQIGETYGSPELIGSYVNSGEMDAQFDFNLYDASVGAFTSNPVSGKSTDYWSGLTRTLNQSFDYYGWHHLMGNISGNQDRPRFASLADGSVKGDEDTKLAGWTRNIQHANDKGYTRMAQMMTLNMTLPGVPVIYYGDEYAMPGGNDPDNRRMMQFENYDSNQQALIQKVKELTALRKSNMALLYGEFKLIPTDASYLAYERNYFGQKIIIVFSKTAGTVTLPKGKSDTYRCITNQMMRMLDTSIQLDMKADDVAMLILNQ
jgi:cyclomaltodextrinase / maltogenic alpha-amylase / neopullulanase